MVTAYLWITGVLVLVWIVSGAAVLFWGNVPLSTTILIVGMVILAAHGVGWMVREW